MGPSHVPYAPKAEVIKSICRADHHGMANGGVPLASGQCKSKMIPWARGSVKTSDDQSVIQLF